MVKQIFFQKTKLIKVEKNGQTRDKKIGKFCIKKARHRRRATI